MDRRSGGKFYYFLSIFCYFYRLSKFKLIPVKR